MPTITLEKKYEYMQHPSNCGCVINLTLSDLARRCARHEALRHRGGTRQLKDRIRAMEGAIRDSLKTVPEFEDVDDVFIYIMDLLDDVDRSRRNLAATKRELAEVKYLTGVDFKCEPSHPFPMFGEGEAAVIMKDIYSNAKKDQMFALRRIFSSHCEQPDRCQNHTTCWKRNGIKDTAQQDDLLRVLDLERVRTIQ